MNKYTIIFILLVTVDNVFAQSHVALFNQENQDSIEASIEDELKSINASDETIKLKGLSVINCQLDSILKNIIEESNGKFAPNYYLALAKHNENLYVEIMNVGSHNNLITFSKRGILSDSYIKKGADILGCVIYNDSFFYVISFPNPNSAEEKDINTLFEFTNKEIVITKENTDDFLFFIDDIVRLYQFKGGKLNLINFPH